MLKYFIIFILVTLKVFSVEITDVKIQGNERLSDETIKVYGDISVPKNYSRDEINNISKELFKTDFFKDIDVSVNDKLLIVKVEEYQIVNQIIIIGEEAKKLKEAILENIKSKVNGSFIKNKLTYDIDITKKLYSSLGYNFAKIESSIEELTANRVNLFFDINKGERTKIKKISFLGDKKLRNSRLKSIIVSEEHKFWKFISKNVYLRKRNIDLDKRLLTNYYKSNGYYDVQILSESVELINDAIELNYTISAGKRYRFIKFETNVEKPLLKKSFIKINKEYKKIIGDYYSPFKIKNLLDNLELLITGQNLQFVEHTVNEIVTNDGISIQLNIYEGNKKTVERINISGNSITNENVIRSEFSLDEGDPFSQLKLDQSIANLKSRNIFGTIKVNVINGSENDLKIIEVDVEEKATGEIAAGAGIGTSGGSLAFTVSENNFLGNGIKTIIDFQASKTGLKGQLSVQNPNFNYSGNSLELNISSQTNDNPSSGYKNALFAAGIGTKFEQYRDIYLSPNLSVSSDKLTVDGTATAAMKKQAGTFSDLMFGYGIAQDKRDRTFLPSSGYITSFNQDLPIWADSPYVRNSFGANKYHTFSQDIIGAVKFYGSAVHGLEDEDVRLSKRNRLSNRKLRGFEAGKVGPKDGDDFVGGNYSTSLNIESSFPNLLPESTGLDIGAFLDFGNIWGVDYSDTIDDSNELRSTAGLNANWTSPIGPISFVISQNISKASTDKVETFNFRLGTSF